MDMLIPLYELDRGSAHENVVVDSGVNVRRAMSYERDAVLHWIRESFAEDGAGWASECAVAFSCAPTQCFIATRSGRLLGFACFDVTAKGLFGPTGTHAAARGSGIGAALLLATLRAMRDAGYAYGVVGGTDKNVKGFYEKVAGAIEIAGSEPGIYVDRLS